MTVDIEITGVGAYVARAGQSRRRLAVKGDVVTVTEQVAEALISQDVAVLAGSVETPEPEGDEVVPFDARGKSADEILAFIESGPSVDEVVAAANGDETAALLLFSAEDSLTDGKPRKTLVAKLKDINSVISEGGGEDG